MKWKTCPGLSTKPLTHGRAAEPQLPLTPDSDNISLVLYGRF